MTMSRVTKRKVQMEIRGARQGMGIEVLGINLREARIAEVGHPYGDLAYTKANLSSLGRGHGRQVATRRDLATLKIRARRRLISWSE